MARLLVTGGAGFIGSNFVHHVLAHTDHHVTILDKLTYAGNRASLSGLPELRWDFVLGDVADAEQLPYDDATFDLVVGHAVLHHIPDVELAMREVLRVLKPGGRLAVTVPRWLPEKICWALSDEYHAPKSVGGHVRIYSSTELKAKLRSAGLDVTADTTPTRCTRRTGG